MPISYEAITACTTARGSQISAFASLQMGENVKSELRNGTVAVEIDIVWDLVALYESLSKWDVTGIVALEALSHALIDTPIGDDVAGVWYKARGGRI